MDTIRLFQTIYYEGYYYICDGRDVVSVSTSQSRDGDVLTSRTNVSSRSQPKRSRVLDHFFSSRCFMLPQPQNRSRANVSNQ